MDVGNYDGAVARHADGHNPPTHQENTSQFQWRPPRRRPSQSSLQVNLFINFSFIVNLFFISLSIYTSRCLLHQLILGRVRSFTAKSDQIYIL